jgi:pectinesterase
MQRRRTSLAVLRTRGLLAVVLVAGACSNEPQILPDAAPTPDSAKAPDAAQTPDAPKQPDATPNLADGSPDAGVAAPDAPDALMADDASADEGDIVIVCPTQTNTVVPSGTAPMQEPGPAAPSTPTRPQLSAVLADSDYTIAKVLARGGTMTGPSTPDVVIPVDGGADDGGSARGEAGSPAPDAARSTDTTVAYSLEDDWDPVTHGIGDVDTFNPLFTVANDGSGTHTSILRAIGDANAIPQDQCARVYIRIKAGTYRERVEVAKKTSAPLLTLYSTESDASKTVIVYGTGAGGMTSSATVTVKAVKGFQMKNLTVQNDYVEDAASTADQSGVALLNQTDQAQFENVRFLGNIATLYVKSPDQSTASRCYFRDCYVEGDQDFIVGRGVAVFDHTEIKYLTSRQATGGAIAAPSTMLNSRYGFLFVSCNFTAEAGASDVALGRQWWEGGNNGVIGKVVIRNSTLGAHIATSPWAPSNTRTFTPKDPTGTTPVTLYTSDDYYPPGTGPSPAEIYLGEYGNVGPGAAQ